MVEMAGQLRAVFLQMWLLVDMPMVAYADQLQVAQLVNFDLEEL
jgi:hypothetical protein